MNIKVSVTSESAGRSRYSATAVVVATVMFAVHFVAAQQVVLKAARVPRVYNALITTDQRLLPSQAEPIVTPVFRPFQFLYEWPAASYAAVPPYSSQRSAPEVEVPTADDGPFPDDGSRPVNNSIRLSDAPPATKNSRPADASPAIKNNRPADSSVPDVPPPPLPVARAPDATASTKKRPEEYPPPPGLFTI